MNSKTYDAFTLQTDARGVTTVMLDVPDRPLNVLDASVMHELNDLVRDLHDSSSTAVVFTSSKESGFLAGADINAITKIASPIEAAQLIDGGQHLFDAIDWLPMPTIAVIHGPCLGGGLEWALACDYRIARDNSSTKIGLPEIKLGLIPGWGGTQRLPKRIGIRRALSMILQGSFLSASEAVKIGLIDRAIEPDCWDSGVSAFVDDVLECPKRARQISWPARLLRSIENSRIGRHLVLNAVRSRTRSKAEHYPAIDAAIRSVRAGFGLRPQGFMMERNEFIDLLATPTCRRLIDLFFAREAARSLRTWTGKPAVAYEKPIRKVGVIGAGAMGAGIGQLAGYRGFEVVIQEVNEEAAGAGRARVKSLIDKLAKRKGFREAERDKLLGQVRVVTDDDWLANADLVIEAVVERIDVKQQVFRALDRLTAPETILATNTSSLSVSEMAAATHRGHLVGGLHFFNPVHKMELVEVVRGKQTDDATIARLVGFTRALGKTPIVTSDSTGFLVNRVLFPYLGEAVLMIAEGYTAMELDRQVRRFGMPMGPCELIDQVGLDVALHVAKSLDGVLQGLSGVAKFLSRMVETGKLGKKSGAGFYRYKNGMKRGPAMLSRAFPKPLDRHDDRQSAAKFIKDGLTPIQRRLIYPMLVEAIRVKQEKVVQNDWAIDLAMVLGTGFAPHRGGPLQVINAIGQTTVLANLKLMQSIYGPRFSSPSLLDEMAKHNQLFQGVS
ncbi:Fatty acid oxidation complex subunit alpha [Novipirellula aureliae]|uniref:enoyl-CoA hydratase n=1 Tax=Novipirellula aureliae TaxID=2527966 RepID=A0A5C6E7W4_9BACT|nr:3-hydroxyacyl-CoA dehydrogenase NAD-binding domain-containing protein [Novipirellula aureliae]TWU43771.1 Fatty acid oxidation complex subunit alpha [Novipirellula aureliae]